jgi:hypothetical protein
VVALLGASQVADRSTGRVTVPLKATDTSWLLVLCEIPVAAARKPLPPLPACAHETRVGERGGEGTAVHTLKGCWHKTAWSVTAHRVTPSMQTAHTLGPCQGPGWLSRCEGTWSAQHVFMTYHSGPYR